MERASFDGTQARVDNRAQQRMGEANLQILVDYEKTVFLRARKEKVPILAG